MVLKLEVNKGFLQGVIIARGLKRHLEERVFIGDSESSIINLMTGDKSSAILGILRQLDSRFYVQICSRESPIRGSPWTETNNRYLIRNGDVIGIRSKGGSRFYKVVLA